MAVERHFLGWDAPVTAKVREFLLPERLPWPADLEDRLIVVPTRQAGRRLREALALHCAERKTALLSPRVVTPTFFLHAGDGPARAANQTEVAAAWAGVLTGADLGEYTALFPGRPPEQDFAWAIETGKTIQELRNTLVDGGYRIADVEREFGGILDEPERWRDLSRLEAVYAKRLEKLGLRDPCDLMIERSEAPEAPPGTGRIVVAAVPDPTPLMIRALERLAEEVPVVVLVHAPQEMEEHFDDWGRPATGEWAGAPIDIPDPRANVVLAGSPASQSHKVLETIHAESGRFGPADIAVGVPDGEVTPFLAADLAGEGLHAFDPSGKKLPEHPLYGLLEKYRDLVCERTYTAVSAFLRHADVLAYLERARGLPARALLEELDKFQNEYIPMNLEEIAGRFPGGEEGERFGVLGKAVAFVRELADSLEEKEIESAVRSFLQTVYSVRAVNPGVPADDDFIEVAELIDAALRELDGVLAGEDGIGKEDGLDLMIERLSTQRYYPEGEDSVIDLEGWLELPWNDAPLLIVTGMNEGSVPDGSLSDVFLPDSLRRQLDLRHDEDRLARDAFLMRGLIESRREEGLVRFIAGKTSGPGAPLKPSRLLFRCGDDELPRRAERLFGDPDERRPNYPSSISFTLDARPPADLPAERLTIDRLSVTRFKDYLACPFRFYLKYALGMEELDDLKTELDAMEFGELVHYALYEMGRNEAMRGCTDERELREFLCGEAERWVRERFGRTPPLTVKIQLDAARQRLGAAARVQAGLAAEGWEILESEKTIEAEIDGVLIRGRIDRVDRHRDTGVIRILDYKTSDKREKPEKVHIGAPSPNAPEYARVTIKGKERRWVDLQLPLYRILLHDPEGPAELGYFDMPKAVTDTGVTTWEGFSAGILESAGACARGIVNDIRDRRFWPAAEKVRHEEFGRLFHDEIGKCVDEPAFTAFLAERARACVQREA